MNYKLPVISALSLTFSCIINFPAWSQELDAADILARIERLEAENLRLKTVIDTLKDEAGIHRIAPSDPTVATEMVSVQQSGYVGISTNYGYEILDHAEKVNQKRILQLKARQNGQLNNVLTLSGQTTVLANYQRSNRDDKFGYLMRHPTFNNQIGDTSSEAVVHSASLATTATLSDSLTAYVEFLYNPEQSFGSGTITSLARNQVQVRKAYLLWGDLNKSPIYAAIGKMDTPFGLNDTVSPFTNSTVWHSFAGLAYGAEVGYLENGLSLRAMAIQGGSQFRAANTPVDGTNVPSRLNNFALDANYTKDIGPRNTVMVGASYLHGSPYCQDYPVFHFNPCEENNPAWSAYGTLHSGPLTLLAEYAQTTEVWPGSSVPDPSNPLSEFAAQKTQSFVFGGRFGFGTKMEDTYRSSLSLEFSSFIAGDSGAPWENQDQWVLGYSKFLAPNINLFSELIHVEGYAPLNFVSGGNFPDGSTWSDRDAQTDVILVGAQAAF